MNGWDAGVRRRAAAVAAHALLLAAVLDGLPRAAAGASSVLVAALIVRSWLRDRAPREAPLAEIPAVPGLAFLGRGIEWTAEHAQTLRGYGTVSASPETDLLLPESALARHLLALGATGTGKSRLLELLAVQAVRRGEAVVIVDPKGDEGLLARIRLEAGPRFRLFSLPHPEDCVPYNPLARFEDVREVADRVAALMPASGDALPFRNFAWDVVNVAARELRKRGRPITLQALRRHGIDRPIGPLADRPREHFLKMVSGLMPVLAKLGSDLLSPEKGGLSWDTADRERQVVYLSLGSLLAPESAAAVARMATLDLASYVGSRQAFSKGWGPISLLVDELGDVVTRELIGVLNKSRSAGFRVVACAQTLSDVEAALGDRARAEQVLVNAATLVQFRTPGSRDAEVFSRLAGTRLLRCYSESSAYEPALLGSGFRTVDDYRARFGESVQWQEAPLVPPWALVDLPVLHFFAHHDGRVFRGRVPVLA